MKQPKTIIKYLVNDPRICFEMTVSVSSQSRSPRPRVFQHRLGKNRNSRVPGTGGFVFARQGAGGSRDEAGGAGPGLAEDAGARGREGEGIAAASPLPGAEALGIIGGEFSDRDEEKGRRRGGREEKGREMAGDSPAGETKLPPSPGKCKEKMGT